MAYVGNIVAFITFLIENKHKGYNVYNYIDKPHFTMNELVDYVSKVLKKNIPVTHYPYWLGMWGGYGFDLLTWISRKKLTISFVRVKKCTTTLSDASKVASSGFRLFIFWEKSLRLLWSLNLYVPNKMMSYLKVNSL